MAKYPLIFDGKFRPMVGPPCHFELTDGAVSVSIRGSHLVAVSIIPRLRTELEKLERERVSSGKFPTQPFGPTVLSWCARKTVESGCVDFRELNKYIVRPKFETDTIPGRIHHPTPHDIFHRDRRPQGLQPGSAG